jgi:hypothetical protein
MSTADTVADGGQDVSTAVRIAYLMNDELTKLKAPEEDGEYKPS